MTVGASASSPRGGGIPYGMTGFSAAGERQDWACEQRVRAPAAVVLVGLKMRRLAPPMSAVAHVNRLM